MADFENIKTADELLNATATDINLDVSDLDKPGMSFGEKMGVASAIAIVTYGLFKGAKWLVKKTGLADKIAGDQELKKQLKEAKKNKTNQIA